MSSTYLYVRKCKKGHPVDNDEPCVLCAQEEKAQEAADNKLLAQLVRLQQRGLIKGVVVGHN